MDGTLDRRKQARGTKELVIRRPRTWPFGSAEQLGQLCEGLAARTVTGLVKSGVLPAPAKVGWYDLPASVSAYFRYKYTAGSTSKDDAEAAKRRYLVAHADVEELEADERAGALIPYAHAETLLTEIVATVRAECDGNAGRLGPLVRATTSDAEARRMLLDEYRGVCERAARKIAELREPVAPPPGTGGDDVDAATAEDGG